MIAVLLGLSVFALIWLAVTALLWGVFTGQLFGAPRADPSSMVIICAALSYIYVAARLFGASLRQR
ncbi:hypothetical protein FHS94_001026 [Sphingomonas aerophila]|uniref:Uncharacterized protein n=1 Tax=Sphingomonas aerophila TaxID=1344948 RepID=A0A7W9BBJ1_9SPHN|nr:hypothetical protein [Sphingomonas aerophila]